MSRSSNSNDDTHQVDPRGSAATGRRALGRGTHLALILWPSFLAAGVAGALFFVAVDPELLRDAGPRIFANLDRERGYALGFFFFWMVSAFSSGLSLFLCYYGRSHRSAGG